jgi:hypothetical protein
MEFFCFFGGLTIGWCCTLALIGEFEALATEFAWLVFFWLEYCYAAVLIFLVILDSGLFVYLRRNDRFLTPVHMNLALGSLVALVMASNYVMYAFDIRIWTLGASFGSWLAIHGGAVLALMMHSGVALFELSKEISDNPGEY